MATAEVELQQSSVETSTAVISNRERAQRRWITVEPVVCFAVFGLIMVGGVKPFYLKSRLAESLYNITGNDNYTSDAAIENEIQEQASLWFLYLNISGSIPVIISSVILGTLSDRLGRKMCMVIPIFGFICQEVVYIATIFFKLPLPVLFLGEILPGMSGSFGLLFAGCTSYVIDITPETKRTLRIAILEMLFLLLSGILQVAVGFLIRDISYIIPILIALGVNITCLMYITIPGILIETVDKENIPEHRKGLKEAGRSVVNLLKFNENGRRWQMLLLDLFLFFAIININGPLSIFILYVLAEPFCWDAVSAGFAGSFGFLSASVGMVVGTKLFALCVGEYWIMQISCLSLLAFSVVVGVSQSTWLIYVAMLLGAFRGTCMPIARSLISRLVDSTETGAAFALVACMDSVAAFIASSMGPSIYAATVKYQPQTVFYVFSGLCAIPAGIIMVLQLLWPRRDNYHQFEDEHEKNEGDQTDNILVDSDGKTEAVII